MGIKRSLSEGVTFEKWELGVIIKGINLKNKRKLDIASVYNNKNIKEGLREFEKLRGKR